MGRERVDLKFLEISHTGDLQIIAYGRTLEELFGNAGLGLYDLAGAQAGRQPMGEKVFTLERDDLESLLVAYLQELLYLIDYQLITCVTSLRISENLLTADLALFSLREIQTEIKAVTYHEMEIVKKSGIYQTLITFDI